MWQERWERGAGIGNAWQGRVGDVGVHAGREGGREKAGEKGSAGVARWGAVGALVSTPTSWEAWTGKGRKRADVEGTKVGCWERGEEIGNKWPKAGEKGSAGAAHWGAWLSTPASWEAWTGKGTGREDVEGTRVGCCERGEGIGNDMAREGGRRGSARRQGGGGGQERLRATKGVSAEVAHWGARVL
jgi:hypothetical protein